MKMGSPCRPKTQEILVKCYLPVQPQVLCHPPVLQVLHHPPVPLQV